MLLFLVDLLIVLLLVGGCAVWWRKSEYTKKETNDSESEDLLWP